MKVLYICLDYDNAAILIIPLLSITFSLAFINYEILIFLNKNSTTNFSSEEYLLKD